jgi:hypothetical protein
MKILTMFQHLTEVFRSYDRRHHRNALLDSIGATIWIILTTLLWYTLSVWGPDVPTIYYSISAGIVRGAQLYYGIILITSVLGFIFDTLSPYRKIIASVTGLVALLMCIVTQMNGHLPPPEFFGMSIALAIACCMNIASLTRIIIDTSSFAAKWREVVENS